MYSLLEIKTRINSVKITKKITKAMQLIATTKLKKAQKNLIAIQEYCISVQEIFQKLLNNIYDISTIFPKKSKNATAYIIVTSDMGLCGSYNTNIFKELKKQLQNNDLLFVLGSKGVSYFKTDNKKMFLELPSVGDNPNYEFAAKIGKDIITQFMSKKINQVKLIYNKFVNSVKIETATTTILPINKISNVKSKNHNSLIEFIPSSKKVLKKLLPLYTSTIIFSLMVESKVSEMSSRRIAMESATDNADELIDSLSLEYNKARQASITQEINEIVSGSMIK